MATLANTFCDHCIEGGSFVAAVERYTDHRGINKAERVVCRYCAAMARRNGYKTTNLKKQ